MSRSCRVPSILEFRAISFPLIIAVLLAFSSVVSALEADAILGQWITEGGGSRIEISKTDDQLYVGTIVSLKSPTYLPGEEKGMDGKERMDLHNQDHSLRTRPLVGLELMKNFQFTSDAWSGGQIYDPENGKTYSCTITLAEDGNLHVRGYVGFEFLGRTTVWQPAKVYLEKELSFLGLGECECQ